MPGNVIRPLTGYIGGKWYLRKAIVPLIDRSRHTCYVEPFMGMANIFLGRTVRRRVEVLNDVNNDVATLFRVVQRHPEELARSLAFQVSARSEYARLFATDPKTLTDIERSVRFLVLRRMTFSGKDAYAQGFATSRSTNKTLRGLGERIRALHTHLDRVTIECLDYKAVMARYDGKDTLTYLDPPYWGCTHLYPSGDFRQTEFKRFAETVKNLRGRWIVSLNDTPEVRALFKGAFFGEVTTRYNANVGQKPFSTTEVVISNERGLTRLD